MSELRPMRQFVQDLARGKSKFSLATCEFHSVSPNVQTQEHSQVAHVFTLFTVIGLGTENRADLDRLIAVIPALSVLVVIFKTSRHRRLS